MKHILITGGNAGIGKATAEALAKKGDTIIIASRNIAKTQKVVDELRRSTKNENIYDIQCDLSSFESIRACTKAYRKQFKQLDTLINNAGCVADKLQFTQNGFELQIGVNHLGHFLLTTELIDLLEASKEARIINVSSDAHQKGNINFDNFRGELGAKQFDGMEAYSQSKLANVLFTKELARRYPTITSHSLHPGVVRTKIASKNNNGPLWKTLWKIFAPFMLSTEKGARTSVYLASSPEALKSNGKYFYKQKEKEPSIIAQDQSLSEKLWVISNKLVREHKE